MCRPFGHFQAHLCEIKARVGADHVVVPAGADLVCGFVIREIDDCPTSAAVHDRRQHNALRNFDDQLGCATQAGVREKHDGMF